MKKQKIIKKSKKVVTLFFRLRRWSKILYALVIGLLSGTAIFRELYSIYPHTGYALYPAVVMGMLISAIMLFMLKCLWLLVTKLKRYATIFWKNYQIRKCAKNENENPK